MKRVIRNIGIGLVVLMIVFDLGLNIYNSALNYEFQKTEWTWIQTQVKHHKFNHLQHKTITNQLQVLQNYIENNCNCVKK